MVGDSTLACGDKRAVRDEILCLSHFIFAGNCLANLPGTLGRTFPAMGFSENRRPQKCMIFKSSFFLSGKLVLTQVHHGNLVPLSD